MSICVQGQNVRSFDAVFALGRNEFPKKSQAPYIMITSLQCRQQQYFTRCLSAFLHCRATLLCTTLHGALTCACVHMQSPCAWGRACVQCRCALRLAVTWPWLRLQAGFTEPLGEGHMPLPTGCYYNQTTHATKPFSCLRYESTCAVRAFLGHSLDNPLNALNKFPPAARTKCRTEHECREG